MEGLDENRKLVKIEENFVSITFTCIATPAKKHGICSLGLVLNDVDCDVANSTIVEASIFALIVVPSLCYLTFLPFLVSCCS